MFFELFIYKYNLYIYIYIYNSKTYLIQLLKTYNKTLKNNLVESTSYTNIL